MTESSEDTSARLLPQGVGIAADVAAVSALVVAGGSPLVVAAGALAVFTGVYVVWKRWAKPVDRTLAVAVAVAALGAGVIGFSVKPSSATSPPADAAASTTSRTTTTTTTVDPTTTSAAAGTAVTTSTSVTTTTTATSTNRRLYSSGSDRELDSIDFEDGMTSGHDLTIGPMSLDSKNGAQFALLEAGAPDPVHSACAARPDGDWRTSVPLVEFREAVRLFCVRTDKGRLGFVEVSAVRMGTGAGIDSVHLRWTVWE
ncbi:hypothetical protein IOD16_02015 [Saccharothrix sp. 6-C]|uniref:hypothetical protein n=1 Tax=Saccharothrix sp. 6-C TaxID=2781735 RepID=UPI001916FF93|nr:hypothetical protein [Saccharothrix sp. 6-C]QQQ77350.1 hypothetical protein IOD16_02015 [Saccharothrix sp. 6-C]